MLDIHQHHITEDNLSVAWAKAFLASIASHEISPLTVTVAGIENGQPAENDRIRQLLDRSLKSEGLPSCETVAGTIFPWSLWNPQRDRTVLFDRYRKILPSIRRCKGNRYGVDADVRLGKIVAVIRHNGADRRTLLKAIFGLLPLW